MCNPNLDSDSNPDSELFLAGFGFGFVFKKIGVDSDSAGFGFGVPGFRSRFGFEMPGFAHHCHVHHLNRKCDTCIRGLPESNIKTISNSIVLHSTFTTFLFWTKNVICKT